MQKSENRQTQMFALVEELFQSKMTRKEFCHQKDIAINRFYYWQKKYRQQAGSDHPDFIPVRTVKGSISGQGFTQPIVLSFPNGISLQLPAGTPIAVIISLLRLA